MKKKTVVLLVVSGLAVVMLYRYGVLSAVSTSICEGKAAKFECQAQAAGIEKKKTDCINACAAKGAWDSFASKEESQCRSDCDYLQYEGKSKKEIDACKAKCALPKYKDRANCSTLCNDQYAKDVADFNKAWK